MKSSRITSTLLVALVAFSGCTSRAKQKEQQSRMLEYRRRVAEITVSKENQRDVWNLAMAGSLFAKAIHDVGQSRDAGLTVIEPKLIHWAELEYPRSMTGKYQEALVYFAFVVDRSGSVVEERHLPVQALEVPEVFVTAARKELKTRKYEPGTIDGLPAPFAYVLPMHFEVQKNASQLVAPTTW